MSINRKLLYIQFTNPAAYPPLEHSSRFLADRGWQILFLGTHSRHGAKAFEFPPHPNIQTRYLKFVPGGMKQKILYLRYLVWVILWVLRWQPCWIYASDLLVCPIAWLLSLFPGRERVIYHEHDSPNYESSQTGFLKLALRARRSLAQRAAFCIFPNEQRGALFRATTQATRPILIVWNCPSREELKMSRAGIKCDKSNLKVYYHGTVVPERIPKGAIKALTMCDARVDLLISGYETIGAPGYGDKLLELAQDLGVLAFLSINTKGLPTRQEVLDLCRTQDVGLSLMTREALRDVNHRHFVGASNKPFDYLACELALLVPDWPDWRATYVETGYGLACDPDDPESIASTLQWFIDHPEQRQEMGKRGRQKILEDWNYEKQFQPVLELMESEARD